MADRDPVASDEPPAGEPGEHGEAGRYGTGGVGGTGGTGGSPSGTGGAGGPGGSGGGGTGGEQAWRRLYVAVGLMLVFVLGMVPATVVAFTRIQDVVADNEAKRCVDNWQDAAEIRAATEIAYRRNADTLLGIADQDVRERLEEPFLAQVERDVDEIRGRIANPECDLDAARERLGG